MQLTNVLRDIGEDAELGRCYLPLAELRHHGFEADDVISGEAIGRPAEWRDFMRQQLARAREYYRRAAPGIALLQPDSQRCATACAVGYSRILDVIERNGYDSHSRRATLRWSERARVLGSLLFGSPTRSAFAAEPSDNGPRVSAA
jgi:phytoene synthase